MPSGASEPIFPVGFDDEAFTEDAEGGSAEAGKAFIELRREIIKQGGLPNRALRHAMQKDAMERTSPDA